MVDSRQKVELGTQIAHRCGEELGKILGTVQEVDGMVAEISSASREQAQGVTEINKAMNQLDQVTQQNAAVSQSAASSAEQLNQQAELLSGMVRDLYRVISGTAHSDGDVLRQTAGSSRTAGSQNRNLRAKDAPSNVVRLNRKADAQTAPRPTSVPQKLAAGAEPRGASTLSGANVPSKDDPRFEDV